MAQNDSKKKENTNVVNDFVTNQMEDDNMRTALAITTDKDGNISFSFNSKDGMNKIAESLAAFIETQSKQNPMFRREFLSALGKLNGVEALETSKILTPQHAIHHPREAQQFINDTLQFIETEIGPTAMICMLTNADPSMVKEDPSQTLPFTYHIKGSTMLMAYGMHSLMNQLNGEAYKRQIPHAISPTDNNGANAEGMRQFTNTWEDLEAMDKRIDHADDKAKK